ncbi:pantetheinase [Caerostris darwini]|uniref:Pantetheinase n=1 Tax=Caerostris darwini TaxID=1538125 RepID=A0AAV4PHR1_9ARAC|nr:pantetheinase [Caerostris darwini]
MEKALCFEIQLIATFVLFVYGSGAGDNYYRAAVLEPVQFTDVSHVPKEVIKRNLDIYETAAKTALANEVDIIVYPECGYVNPCVQKDKFHNYQILSKLSCLAKENKLYVVANTLDFKKCKTIETCDADGIDECPSKESACPEDGGYFYNTNIVFDRKGTLVSRYYKKHLFFEKNMNTPDFPQDATFNTDFGNFTTVICFDLIFKESVEDVEKPAVVNLAYPTYWFDHVPYIFFATPYQQAWAMMNNVNLLAANVHTPGTGTLGSGIYTPSKGALIYTHNPDFRTKLLNF